ncbi:MAG: formylglycine-generating enzyme family protein [Xanthomonadales bacterium]|nr:formylglycine-generating enzyme family protein [Xanthomonadales bacterium]
MKNEGRQISIKQLRVIIGLAGAGLFLLVLLVVGQLRSGQGDDGTAVDPSLVESAGGSSVGAEDPGLDDLAEGPRPWRDGVVVTREGVISDIPSELALADAALEAGILFEPDKDNALSHYMNILMVDPENEAAQEGVDSIAAQLFDRLQTHIDGRDMAAAAAIYPVLTTLRPGDSELERLGDRLESLERSAELLLRAKKDIAAQRWIDPPNRNALSRLLRALELDPGNSEISDLLLGLERTLVDEALQSARALEFEDAERWITAAAEVRGGSSAVSQANEQIREYRTQQIDRAVETARVAMRDSRFGEAVAAIESVRSLGGNQILLASLDEELRLSRIYNVFRPGQVFADDLNGSRGPEMVVIPHGSFAMGAAAVDTDRTPFEGPLHPVRFERGFALSRTEVSVAQFAAFVEATGYTTQAESEGFSSVYNEASGRISKRKKVTWRDTYNGREAKPGDPVMHVSWHDATAYANWLSRTTGRSYRLPSEAEYEYAARGGRQTRYWWGMDGPTVAVENLTGDGDRSPRRRTWSKAFTQYEDGHWGPAPVGTFDANPFGLFDMAGNVQEWVADCWHDSYARAPTDGAAWINRGCPRRVVRGGFWGGAPDTARVSHRLPVTADNRGPTIGFRVARDLVVVPDNIASN